MLLRSRLSSSSLSGHDGFRQSWGCIHTPLRQANAILVLVGIMLDQAYRCRCTDLGMDTCMQRSISRLARFTTTPLTVQRVSFFVSRQYCLVQVGLIGPTPGCHQGAKDAVGERDPNLPKAGQPACPSRQEAPKPSAQDLELRRSKSNLSVPPSWHSSHGRTREAPRCFKIAWW